MSQDFGLRDLGKAVIEILGLRPGDEVEILRDRLNPLRIMLVRRTNDTDQSTKSGQSAKRKHGPTLPHSASAIIKHRSNLDEKQSEIRDDSSDQILPRNE